jgi:hypothetical protein
VVKVKVIPTGCPPSSTHAAWFSGAPFRDLSRTTSDEAAVGAISTCRNAARHGCRTEHRAFRTLARQQRRHAVDRDVNREREERPADDTQRHALHLLAASVIQVGTQSPLRRSTGRHRDDAIDPEPDERDAPRTNAGHE